MCKCINNKNMYITGLEKKYPITLHEVSCQGLYRVKPIISVWMDILKEYEDVINHCCNKMTTSLLKEGFEHSGFEYYIEKCIENTNPNFVSNRILFESVFQELYMC